MPRDPKDVVRTVERLWSSGKLDELDGYFAPSFKPETGFPQLPPGLEGAKAAHMGALHAFPDRKTEIVDLVANGNKVVVRMRVTGTNRGGVPPLGVPANGAKVDFQWISIYQVKGGKIVDHWAVNDGLTLLRQLGGWKPPAA